MFKEPSEFDKILGRGNVILEGARGSGKTMILKYLSIEAQLADLIGKGKSADSYDRNFVGVYLKISAGPFKAFGNDPARKEEMEILFSHYFNMLACEKIFASLIFAEEKKVFRLDPRTKAEIIKSVLEKLKIEWSAPPDSRISFQVVVNACVKEQDNISDFINHSVGNERVVYPCVLTHIGTFLYSVCEILCTKIPFMQIGRRRFYLLRARMSTFLQLLKETGMRSGEAWGLEWIDFNFEKRTVRVTPEKGGNPRALKISNKLIAMLNSIPKNHQRPFKGSLRHFARTFRRQRKRAVNKLKNKRIEKITFHTLRHWKATMEYHKTKDILHVKQMLGHKSIQNTLIHTHLVNFEEDQFTCKVARTLKEAENLIEAGFDYITDVDGAKLFRKRK